MKWTKSIRASSPIEYVCERGTGHPDKQSAQRLAKKYKHSVETWMVHCCDGCCDREDFPGK